MADNYLERKMEEHRAGRDTAARRRRGGAAPLSQGMPRRIAVIARGRHHLSAIIAPLRHPDIRLAVLNTIPDAATDLGPDHGIRYYSLSGSADAPTLHDALTALHRAWLGLDLLIITDPDHETASVLSSWLPTRIPDGTSPMAVIIAEAKVLRRLTLRAPGFDIRISAFSTLPDTGTCAEAAHIPYLAASPDLAAISL